MDASNRKLLLLVEDEAIIALAERRALESYGYAVRVAASGEAAVAAVEEDGAIDLILMDIDLGPGIDGPRAAELILEKTDIPVVFLSAHREPETVAKTESITSYGYVVKNSSITVLDASIKMAFKLYEANRRTAESERKQNALISGISDVIVIIGADYTNRYKSPNVERLFGWKPEELVGRHALDNVHPDDRTAAAALLERIARSPNAAELFECRYRRADGAYVWIEISVANRLDDPLVAGYLGNYHDISDRKAAERERESERRFAERMIESLPGIFYLYSYPELRLVRWNRNHERLMGYGPGEIADKPLMEWHADGAEGAVREAVDNAMGAGFNVIEAPLRKKDGSFVPFLLTGAPFETGDRRFLMGIGIDVTEKRAVEDALRRSEESLETTLQSIGDGVIAVDTEGRITRMNPVAEELTGWDFPEARGRPLNEVFRIVNAETGEPAVNPVARVLSEGVVVGLANHTALLRRDGGVFQIADSAAPIRGLRGTVEGVVLVFSDVSDRYRMEEELRESRERLTSLFSAMTEMVVLHELVLDGNGIPTDYRILDCNPAFTRITGIPREAALGRLATEVYAAERAPYLEVYSEVARSGSPREYETYYPPMDKHFAISVVSPGSNRFATITTDITDIKLVQERLRRKSEELDLFFDSSLDLLCIADTEGRFLRLSPEWERVLGYPVRELEGTNFMDFVHPDDKVSTMAELSALGRRQSSINFVNRYRCADGSWRWIEWRSQSPGGDIIYANARDITERIRMEERLQRQVGEKELLLKEVHHRLKNNLSSIEGLLSIQLRGTLEPSARDALADALGRIGSMRVLYEKLLEGNDFGSSPVKAYLESVITSVFDLFPSREGITLSLELDDFSLSSSRLFPLGIIVNELLTNAMKYAFRGRDRGKISIVLKKETGKATLTVADDGKGLPDGYPVQESGGFGLALVSMLAEQLGGGFSSDGSAGMKAVVRFDV